MVNTKMFYHPKYYKELRDAGNELAKRDAVKEDLARPGSSPARNKSDQAISKSEDDGQSERASDPGHKPQDNNASFEGISEAEYNKRHMKALKDVDPGLKLPGPRPISNANKGLIHRRQASSSKLQASSSKRQAFEPT